MASGERDRMGKSMSDQLGSITVTYRLSGDGKRMDNIALLVDGPELSGDLLGKIFAHFATQFRDGRAWREEPKVQ